MFERFTEKAIKVIMLAQEEARRLGHHNVGTEQILLGLIGEGTGIAAKTLKARNVNLKDARVEVEKIVGRGPGGVFIEIPFTPTAKRALEYAWDEARQLGHNFIGTEHLLLGVVRVDDDNGASVLKNMGVDIYSIKPAVIAAIDRGTGITPNKAIRLKAQLPSIDKYSDGALRAFVLAREETRRLGHEKISPELLLLGLIAEDKGLAAKLLKAENIKLSDARTEVEKVIGRGSGAIPVESPFSEVTSEMLEDLWRTAKRCPDESISTEHLLLGLVRIKSGTERVFRNLRIDQQKLEQGILSEIV